MRGRARALLRHVTTQLGPVGEVEHSDVPWHSATFNGVHHRLVFTVDPAVDVTAFAHALPEADIMLPDGFVADALVTGTEPSATGTRVSVEVLTIDAA